MNGRSFVTVALLGFVVATVAYIALQSIGKSVGPPSASGQPTGEAVAPQPPSVTERKVANDATDRPRGGSPAQTLTETGHSPDKAVANAATPQGKASGAGGPKPQPATAPRPGIAVGKASHWVFVYYFYNNIRCESCRKIEMYTQSAVQRGFEKELQEGTVVFFPINIDEPGGQRFIRDYRLYSKQVIVSDMHNGKETRWKDLKRVWELLNDPDAFDKYIWTEVAEYVKQD